MPKIIRHSFAVPKRSLAVNYKISPSILGLYSRTLFWTGAQFSQQPSRKLGEWIMRVYPIILIKTATPPPHTTGSPHSSWLPRSSTSHKNPRAVVKKYGHADSKTSIYRHWIIVRSSSYHQKHAHKRHTLRIVAQQCRTMFQGSCNSRLKLRSV